MRTLAAAACLILLLSGCASTAVSPAGKAERCSVIAEVARSQYGFGPELGLPLSEDSWGTDCDWTANGVPMAIVRSEDFDILGSQYQFEQPRQRGGMMTVKAIHSGHNFIVRTCRLRRDGDGWRLVSECPITDYRH